LQKYEGSSILSVINILSAQGMLVILATLDKKFKKTIDVN